MTSIRHLSWLLVLPLLLLAGCQEDQEQLTAPAVPTSGSTAAKAGPLSGAIFTTTVDGAIVNENVHYEAKEDVYLDGGPGPNAPINAAGLPEGDYYFQVTDPSGKDLLSTDHISCRMIHINDDGVIDIVYDGKNYVKERGEWVEVDCKHNEGTDLDHGDEGAITVQLFPYDDTPNRGGVYKVWITPVDQYTGDRNFVPGKGDKQVNGENYQPGDYHGFVPRWSKTDNYKVKSKFPPPEITIRKFHDANFNGVFDAGEEEIEGWMVTVTDPLGCETIKYTPAVVLAAEPGDYVIVEDIPVDDGCTVLQTVSILDGAVVSLFPSADPTVVVSVAGSRDETHEVIYGNAGTTDVGACKVYDKNANGAFDPDEVKVAGWAMRIVGTDVTGAAVDLTQYTGDDGCTVFEGLLPGSYTISEIMPTVGTWVPVGPTSFPFELDSTLCGAYESGGLYDFEFFNFCTGEADFGTKGYWHNKNGLLELSFDPDIVDVNGLAPYASPSDYFGAGDEPFDGMFEDGTLVAASNGVLGDEIAPAGSWQAEVSQFLVDANAGGDPREQLAQQLLAFIFNVQHRLDGYDAAIEMPDGSYVAASALIADAVAAWESGDAGAMASLLDAFNNNDAVKFVHGEPCDLSY